MRKFIGTFVIVVTVLFMVGCFVTVNNMTGGLQMGQLSHHEEAILFLKLEGVIMDGEQLLEPLREYAKEDFIKGVLIQINSPGGVVGPSQELYAEIKRVREELKKPVVVSCLGMAASGAYYAAVAADKIITNPGSLLGSIGVIMEFANLEKLYDWAHIKRFSITTGAYKDSGAEHRPMRDDERMLFQSLANEVLLQFRKAISEGRKLPLETVTKYSDGRVFTGATAVSLGLADEVGTLQDATRIVGQLAKLGNEPVLFTPPADGSSFLKELFTEIKSSISLRTNIEDTLGVKLLGQPLFLMPGARF